MAGRATRLSEEVDIARKNWKQKYHDAIAQRNEEQVRVKELKGEMRDKLSVERGKAARLRKDNSELKMREESAYSELIRQKRKCADGECSA